METAPLPPDEDQRLAALHALNVLDTPPDPELDALVARAAEVSGAPIALVSLVDADRQWFKANVGLPGTRENPRTTAFCAHAILSPDVMVVPDASLDRRFEDNPVVTGDPDVRFYAGVPLQLSGGQRIGTLCVIDSKRRELDPAQLESLRELGRAVVRRLEASGQAGPAASALASRPYRPAGEAARLIEASTVTTALAAAVVTGSEDAIVAKSLDGTVLAWNRGAERVFGYTAAEMIGKPITQLFPPELLHEESRLIALIQGGENVSHFETQRVRKDGSLVEVSVSLSPVRDGEGRIFAVSKIARDITDRVHARRALEEQRELLAVTLGSIADAVVTTDVRGRIDWMNRAAERLTGWLSDEAHGLAIEQVLRIIHEDTREIAENPVRVCLARSEVVGLSAHTVLVSRGGAEHGIEDSAAPIRDGGGVVRGVVLVFHDVTEQRRMSGEMSYKATHDGLTGLLNRSEFEARLRRALLNSHEDSSQHALLYVDLDQFKLVNDACGHAVGDQLLQQVSRILSDTLRSRDTLARLGGDEFGAILEHCTTDQALRVAQKICEHMEHFRFIHDRRRFRIGASIGLVPVDRRWSTTAAIVQAADTSCYAAKEAGRNRVHVWFDTDHAMRARHGEMQWAERIELALDENRIELYFQRIVPSSSDVHGLHGEVLVRIREPDGTLVAPGAFLPAAERFHLATRIDRRVLRLATEWLASQADLSGIEMLCVNLSGQSIGDRAFHRPVVELFRSLRPEVLRRLCLEVTETVVVTNLADASLFVEQMRELGVRTALDDFGAGASSFGYLKSLKVDLLKIDGQFVQGLLDAPLDRAAVRCFVEVAQVMGIKTVAEFVDRSELLAEVKALGVDYAQGYLLHRPEPLTQAACSQCA